jgi:Ca-activated chloride channel homolog
MARSLRRSLIAVALSSCALVGCISTSQETTDGGGGIDNIPSPDLGGADPGDCVPVDMAVSSEKITLMTELANEFNGSDVSKVDGKCSFIRPFKKSSGAAAQLIVDGWPDTGANGERPAIWSPSASSWGAIVNQRSGQSIATDGAPFMLTPLVIAMPKPMADALGYPAKPVGFADIVALSKNPEGWAAFGHPEWGPFRLGKTNPNFSTSGLNFTIAGYYAATGKTSGLTIEDLQRADVEEFARGVESSVVHYGDITMTFLNNWFRADARGTALTYASAVAVEEKSVIDYNAGNPDGILDSGEEPRKPKVPLVAIYPTEGTLFSDNPLFVLNTEWVSAEQKAAATKFTEFLQLPENQQKVLEFGFRPGNPAVPVAAPIIAANGVDPSQPQAELEVPAPAVLTGVLDAWAEHRKTARVLIVLDVSGSMEEDGGDGRSKLDLAQEAAKAALSEFKAEDEVGLWVFTTDINQNGDGAFYRELAPIAPIGANEERMRNEIDRYGPLNGTPLYDISQASFDAMKAGYDPTKINAVVLLTDGVNDDGDPSDDSDQIDGLIRSLRAGSEGSAVQPIRVFTISYGAEADRATLKRIAEATNAALYDASNPQTINQVFTAVVSNF